MYRFLSVPILLRRFKLLLAAVQLCSLPRVLSYAGTSNEMNKNMQIGFITGDQNISN